MPLGAERPASASFTLVGKNPALALGDGAATVALDEGSGSRSLQATERPRVKKTSAWRAGEKVFILMETAPS